MCNIIFVIENGRMSDFSPGKKSHHIDRYSMRYRFMIWVFFMRESGKTEHNSDFQLHRQERVIHARLGNQPSSPVPRRKRERNAEPLGELREGFPRHWTSKELSLSRSVSCVRPSSSEKNVRLLLFWLSRICSGVEATAGLPQHTPYRPRLCWCSPSPWWPIHGCCIPAVYQSSHARIVVIRHTPQTPTL